MNHIRLKTLLAGLAFISTVAVAGLAEDVQQADQNEESVRAVVDVYIASPDFDFELMMAEIEKMPVNGSVSLIYLVEANTDYADAVVKRFAESNPDLIVKASILAAKAESPAMCALVAAAAKNHENTALESIAAIADEAPSKVSEAVECAANANPEILGRAQGAAVGPDLPQDPIQTGGGARQPISPN